MAQVIERPTHHDIENPIHDIPRIAGQDYSRLLEEKETGRLNILHITTTDPAGAGYAFVQAINRHTKHRARILNTHPNVFRHPEDISTVYDYYDEFEALLLNADIIHFHKITEDYEVNLPEGSKRERKWLIKDFLTVNGRRKKRVYHIHGHPYERANFAENGKYLAEKNSVVLCSTPDLELLYKPYADVKYFPNCVPVNDMLYLPRATGSMLEDRNGTQRYVVGHTVSAPHLKDVDSIVRAVEYVAKTQPVNYLQIENRTHSEAMKMKRHCHIIFDHMQSYYGIGSLEGFALGKPVIAGLNDYCIERIMDFFQIPEILPWQIARDYNALRDAVMDLVANPEMAQVIGKRSRLFMENIWSDKYVAQRLAALYESI